MIPADLIPAVRAALTEGRRLIADVGWTQGARARNAQGVSTSAYSPEAVCFCALGAIDRAIHGVGPEAMSPEMSGLYWAALDYLSEIESPADGAPVDYNDAPNREAAEVVALFDLALAGLEEPAETAAVSPEGGPDGVR